MTQERVAVMLGNFPSAFKMSSYGHELTVTETLLVPKGSFCSKVQYLRSKGCSRLSVVTRSVA